MIPHDASGLVADAFIPAFDAVAAKVEGAVIADLALHQRPVRTRSAEDNGLGGGAAGPMGHNDTAIKREPS